MIKIFHEAPKKIFHDVQLRTDGDYALCHLLEQDEEYADIFKRASLMRETILDNSVFELEKHVGWETLVHWAVKLNPDWVVLPDVLDNCWWTVTNAGAFIRQYGSELPKGTKLIGVVQAMTYNETKECYLQLEGLVDMIAFSFNMTGWRNAALTPVAQAKEYMMQRILMLNRLEQDGIIDKRKMHHLLGCALPQEFIFQRRPWIYSLDTSNPVMWGLTQGKYPGGGPSFKPEGKLYEHINDDVSEEQRACIISNMHQFRKWCSK